MKDTVDRYDADYPYKKRDVTVINTGVNFPLIEHTNNALLFPEGVKDEIDLKEFKPGE